MKFALLTTIIMAMFSLTGCSEEHGHDSHEGHNHDKHQENSHDEHGGREKYDEHGHDEHENHIEISDKLIVQYGIEVETVAVQHIKNELAFYGMIQIPQDRTTVISAPYQSKVSRVYVSIGDKVRKGQNLIRLTNTKNLQSYTIRSPANGLITERWVNNGEITQQDALLKIADLSKVWVDFTVFPKQLMKLKEKQPLVVSSLDDEVSSETVLNYILPSMTDGHLAKARAIVDNKNGTWFAGMHVMVKVTVSEQLVNHAVKLTAIQTIEDKTVVFVKEGKHFEPKEITTGLSDGVYIEVLTGLNGDEEYVTKNSFVMKADLMKHSAGHGHAH